MSLDFKYIAAACNAVMMLGESANWRFKALPVLVWEFATLDEYFRARMDLMRCMDKNLVMGPWRKITSEIEELDCYGVTFRLVCQQKRMTPHGPYGAADFKYG